MQPLTYIAGPCAAESEEQVMTTARALAQTGDIIFRAGAWKPRTRPDTFQGVGEKALLWLSRVQKELHLPVATEVSNAEQVTKALAAGMDYLWIGARTSANPIAVQQIANAIQTSYSRTQLQGILLKNPVNDDVALWEGNIRRLLNAGCKVMAVHRGCNHQPYWKMAYQLRQDFPDIPLLLDPSHMSGDAERVSSLCQVAAELEYSGLMIEVHPQPQHALSDAKQQITPDHFAQIRQIPFTSSTTPLPLRWLRKMMDEVDDRLWTSIAQRMEVSRRIGEYKKENNIQVVQPTRFDEIRTKRLAWAENQNLSKEAVKTIMETLHEESIRVQQ